MSNIKRTPLYTAHLELGARMVEFAGWEMPVQYTGLMAEHEAVRSTAGMFDLSHMGEIRVAGADAQAFLQRCTTNDVTKLVPGKVQYSLLCREDGGIVDDILVYCHPWGYELVVNASNKDKDLAWLVSHQPQSGVEIVDVSDSTALIAVQGPLSESIVVKALDVAVSDLRYYTFTSAQFDAGELTVSRTGYTGEDGFEIYLPATEALELWNRLKEAGGESLVPVGLGARDTLRLEMCYSLYGHEIGEETNPYEAGLGWVVKADTKDFIGKSALVSVKGKGPDRKLVALTLESEPGSRAAVPRQGYPVYVGGQEVGAVTSGTFSPTLQEPICLAYVPAENSELGTTVEIGIRRQRVKAVVVKKPFVSPNVKR